MQGSPGYPALSASDNTKFITWPRARLHIYFVTSKDQMCHVLIGFS